MKAEPLALAFDTSAAHCAAALMAGDVVLAERREDMGRGQAERLMPLLEEILAEAGKTWRDLTVIGVGVGPGNFTGIRISVSAARGLAMALNIPAVGVSALDALALDAGPAIAAIAAPRGALFWRPPGGDPVQTQLEEMDLPPALNGANAIGHAAEQIAALTGGRALAPKHPLAQAIARLALRRLDSGDLTPPAPLYARAADAAPSRDAPVVLLD